MITDDDSGNPDDLEDLVRKYSTKYARYLPKKKKTAVEELKEYSRSYVAKKYGKVTKLSTPKIAKEILPHFPMEFYERLGRELAYDIVYNFLQRDLAPSQQTKFLRKLTDTDRKVDDTIVGAFTNWREETGPGSKILLIMLNIEEGKKAAAIRIKGGEKEVRHGRWILHLISKLKGDQVIKDVWTFAALLESYQRMVELKPTRKL
jgi:hypothetical protein